MKKSILILCLFLIPLTSATTIQLGNTSNDYELCIYTPEGKLEGCANNTNSVNITTNDFIFQLQRPNADLFNKPLTFFNYLPPILSILTVTVLLIIFVGGFTKTFGKIL